MADGGPTEPMTVRASKQTVEQLDALAETMDRSRNYLVNQAIEQYLETNAWQVAKIKEGLEDARAGRLIPAEEAFASIAAKHGWKR